MDRSWQLVEELAQENVVMDSMPTETLYRYIKWARRIVKAETDVDYNTNEEQADD